MKLSKAQQKMVDRIQRGASFIGYGRNWYFIHDGRDGYVGKANDNTIDALLRMGIVEEVDTPKDVTYRVILKAIKIA